MFRPWSYACALGFALFATPTFGDILVDFNGFNLDPQSYLNGRTSIGGFSSQGVHFANNYSFNYNSWQGWAISNVVNTSTPGVGNQYASYPGGGYAPLTPPGGGDPVSGEPTSNDSYGIAFLGAYSHDPAKFNPLIPRITIPTNHQPASMMVANTTYAAMSMLRGDQFAKKFGGATGNDPDFLELRVLGLNASMQVVGEVPVVLADYRAPGTSSDFISSEWLQVDLSSLQGHNVTSLSFAMYGSDIGQYGINTPAYFAMDNLLLTSTGGGGGGTPQTFNAGDMNRDGKVDRTDVVSFIREFGASGGVSFNPADFNSDGSVNLLDLSPLQGNLTNPYVIGGSPSAVPEPGTAALVVAAFCLFGARSVWRTFGLRTSPPARMIPRLPSQRCAPHRGGAGPNVHVRSSDGLIESVAVRLLFQNRGLAPGG